MAKPPGFAVEFGQTLSFPSAGTAVSGDLVTLDANGQVAPSDADNSIGVVSDVVEDGHDAGDNIEVRVGGVVVSNVASGTVAGEGLGEPDSAATGGGTAGEMNGVGGSEYDVLSDEGGSYKGASMETGYAAVNLG